MEKPVAGVHELFDRELEALGASTPGVVSMRSVGARFCRRVRRAASNAARSGSSDASSGRDRRLAGVERGAHGSHGEGETLDDKRFQAPGEIGGRVNRGSPGHGEMLTLSGSRLRAQGSGSGLQALG